MKYRTKSRIIDPYKTRNQELTMEENKRAQRKTLNWKRRQRKKVGREVPLYYPSLSPFPVEGFSLNSCTLLHIKFLRKVPKKKLMKKPQNKNKQINKQEQITEKSRKKTIKTTHMREKEKCSLGRLGEGANNPVQQ